MSKKVELRADGTADTYSALLHARSKSPEHELRELLAEADARVAPCLTHSMDDSRLMALIAVVRERTHEEDLKTFREVMHEVTRDMVNVEDASERIAGVLIKVATEIRRLQRHQTASNARSEQLKSSPKQIAKTEASKLWEEWRAGKHPRIGKKIHQFAAECQRRWPKELTSHKVICGWCTDWSKQAREMKKPAG